MKLRPRKKTKLYKVPDNTFIVIEKMTFLLIFIEDYYAVLQDQYGNRITTDAVLKVERTNRPSDWGDNFR